MPELKRVVVAFGNSIVMEPSLEQALVRLFGEQAQQPETPGVPGEPPPATEDTVPGLVAQAREFYDQAQKRLQTGDWAGYGESLNQLNDVIRRLEGLTQQ